MDMRESDCVGRHTWRVSKTLTPLEKTLEKPGQGEYGLEVFYAHMEWPSCSKHGAMNKVSGDRDWWRCLTCNIGCEWKRKASGEGSMATKENNCPHMHTSRDNDVYTCDDCGKIINRRHLPKKEEMVYALYYTELDKNPPQLLALYEVMDDAIAAADLLAQSPINDSKVTRRPLHIDHEFSAATREAYAIVLASAQGLVCEWFVRELQIHRKK